MLDRNEVLETIMKYAKMNITDMMEEDIDPNTSVYEYGASSLDLLEIVSSSMRKLGLRVPRTELSELETLNELVDVFMEYLAEAEESSEEGKTDSKGTVEGVI